MNSGCLHLIGGATPYHTMATDPYPPPYLCEESPVEARTHKLIDPHMQCGKENLVYGVVVVHGPKRGCQIHTAKHFLQTQEKISSETHADDNLKRLHHQSFHEHMSSTTGAGRIFAHLFGLHTAMGYVGEVRY